MNYSMTEYFVSSYPESRLKTIPLKIAAHQQLLFVRQLKGQLTELGPDLGSGKSNHQMYLVHGVEKSDTGGYIPCSVAFSLDRNRGLSEVVIGVGKTSIYPGMTRDFSDEQAEHWKKEIENAINRAAAATRNKVLARFAVGFRADNGHPYVPPRLMKVGPYSFFPMAPEEDGERKGWGYNAGVGFSFDVAAVYVDDAYQVAAQQAHEFVILWSFVSGSYCRVTKRLFAVKDGNVKSQIQAFALDESFARAQESHSVIRGRQAANLIRKLIKALTLLPPPERLKLIAGLAAYRTAQEVRSRNYHTRSLAVVAYTTAMEAVLPKPEKCSGKVRCEICGSLENHRHPLESNQSLLLKAAKKALPGRTKEDVRAFVQSIYRAYRSAYVHSGRSPFRDEKGGMWPFDLVDEDAFWEDERTTNAVLWNLDDVVRRILLNYIETELKQLS